MRIRRLIIALTLFASGCGAADLRIRDAEQFVRNDEHLLARVDDSYDLSERDIARMRLAVDDIVAREHNAAQQLEMAAREYEYATVHYHLASNEFVRAARNYEIAAAEYEMVAAMIVRASSSNRLVRDLCGRSTNAEGVGEALVARRGNVERVLEGQLLKLPLSVLKSIAGRAMRMLLCRQ